MLHNTLQSHVLQHKLLGTLATVDYSVGWRTIDSGNYVMRTQPLKTQDKLTALQCTTQTTLGIHISKQTKARACGGEI